MQPFNLIFLIEPNGSRPACCCVPWRTMNPSLSRAFPLSCKIWFLTSFLGHRQQNKFTGTNAMASVGGNELATKLGDPNSIRGTHIVRTESCRLSSDLLTCTVACAFAHTYMYLQRQFLKMAHWFCFQGNPSRNT